MTDDEKLKSETIVIICGSIAGAILVIVVIIVIIVVYLKKRKTRVKKGTDSIRDDNYKMASSSNSASSLMTRDKVDQVDSNYRKLADSPSKEKNCFYIGPAINLKFESGESSDCYYDNITNTANTHHLAGNGGLNLFPSTLTASFRKQRKFQSVAQEKSPEKTLQSIIRGPIQETKSEIKLKEQKLNNLENKERSVSPTSSYPNVRKKPRPQVNPQQLKVTNISQLSRHSSRISVSRISTEGSRTPNQPVDGVYAGDNHPMTDSWELPRSKLEIIKKIGDGMFGEVWEGQVKEIMGYKSLMKVAIKTIREDADDDAKRNLIKELHYMKTLQAHPNVIALLGCVTTSHPMAIVMELAKNGNLQTYLRRCRYNNIDASFVTQKTLTRFAMDVANGMSFISSKKVRIICGLLKLVIYIDFFFMSSFCIVI